MLFFTYHEETKVSSGRLDWPTHTHHQSQSTIDPSPRSRVKRLSRNFGPSESPYTSTTRGVGLMLEASIKSILVLSAHADIVDLQVGMTHSAHSLSPSSPRATDVSLLRNICSPTLQKASKLSLAYGPGFGKGDICLLRHSLTWQRGDT
ncbi:hypothetical protein O181_026530 [Austropuccinia psidii MF-1]|uniref:Uncharacterized protein n=1 Tax=Austropuccinia psidii MF-1 TaxID=1389203 RepID=A0A9Q3CPK3_9BASI|nr:hypothetical protein [Austropuccinia psidii MF-1]